MKIKHSKYRNTGILFELLIRQITSDTLKGEDSPAIDIVKEYFTKTTLGKEYKLYESILKSNVLNENRATIVLDTVLESSSRFHRNSLKRQKYNLIKEIKKHYDLSSFFGAKISNYKTLASTYILIEGFNSLQSIDTTQTVDNKINILEHLTKSPSSLSLKKTVINEFSSYDKDVRSLTYKILLEKFNSKYDSLNVNQKQTLKEYINSVDSSSKLKDFYNIKINEIKSSLSKEIPKIKDKATKIKTIEVSKLLVELLKTDKFKDNNLMDLLHYYGLIEEIKLSHEA